MRLAQEGDELQRVELEGVGGDEGLAGDDIDQRFLESQLAEASGFDRLSLIAEVRQTEDALILAGAEVTEHMVVAGGEEFGVSPGEGRVVES